MAKNKNLVPIIILLLVASIFIYTSQTGIKKESFSIAGNNWGCDALPVRNYIFSEGDSLSSYFELRSGESASISSSSGGCSDMGLFDVFEDWAPKTEYKNSLDYTCPVGKTCQIQLYCCDHQDCSDDSDCEDWFGQGYTCKSTSIRDTLIDFEWSSWKYCKAPTDTNVNCYRRTNNRCGDFYTYTQTYLDANFEGNCPPTWPYVSLSKCQEDIKRSDGQSCTSNSQCLSNVCNAQGKCETPVNCKQIDASCNSDSECCSKYCSEKKCMSRTNNEFSKLTLTEDAFNDATYITLMSAACSLGEDCSKDNILTGESVNKEDYNWTVSCKSSVSISQINQNAVYRYFEVTDPTKFAAICEFKGLLGNINQFLSWASGVDKCENLIKSVPSGTCRATIKASSAGFCWPTANEWLSPYTKINDCQTNTLILIMGVAALLFITMRFANS